MGDTAPAPYPLTRHSLDTLVYRSVKRSRDLFANEHGKASVEEDSRKAKIAALARAEYGHVMHIPIPVIKGKQAAKSKDILAITDGAGSKLVGDGMSPAVAAATKQGNQQQLALVQQAQKDKKTLATRAPVMPKPAWHPKWKLMRVISGHLGWVRACVVEPGNKWFATGAADRVIKIWDMASGTLKLTLTGHISTVRGLAVSPRHPYLFSVAEDKTVKCWDLECNKVIRHYHGHLSAVHSVALHPTLDVLLTTGRDSSVRVWDMRTKSQVHCLTGHTNTTACVLARGADPQVISGSHDSTIRLWDLTAGKTLATLTNHKKSVRAMVLHPTENTFISGAPDNIKEWYCNDGKFIQNLSGHNAVINALAINQNGVLVSGADNGTMSFWDYRTGYRFQQMDTIVQPGSLDSEAGIYAMQFDKSGSRLITCEADKTIKMYKEDPNSTEETDPVEWKPTVIKRSRF